MKHIISMSIYGRSKMYLLGGLQNIDFIKRYYGDPWIPRFYVAENCPALSAYLKEQEKGTCEVVQMPAWDYVEGSTVNGAEHHNFAHTGMCFRYQAIFDPDVEIVLTRDSDSRVGPRDAASVQEWLGTGLPIHVMSDNPVHNSNIIMPGLMGFHAPTIRNLYKSKENYSILYNQFIKWYATKGFDAGLRWVHWDIHAIMQLFVKPLGERNIYRCGYGTDNPLKVPMPPSGECGNHLGCTVDEHLRYSLWEHQ